nr:recombinase family protein [Pseudovibrio brasiliensis]
MNEFTEHNPVKFGYARVSTSDQSPDMQIDALKQAGCRHIYVEQASGAKSERKELQMMLGNLQPGDVIVIWKLDRLGRTMSHLLKLVNELNELGVGLISLNDPIDTTTPQGKLMFHIFASLAEFERDLIKERTQAGLSAARVRGRMSGRPKGLSKQALQKAAAAEALYSSGEMSVTQITRHLEISRASLYKYLRYRGVEIGKTTATGISNSLKLNVTFWVERNSKHVRGKKHSYENIEMLVLASYEMVRHSQGEYTITVTYRDEQDLEEIIQNIMSEIHEQADWNNCFAEDVCVAAMDGSERMWN